ncbi:hypothetical protein, partial [Enterobacter hormaechei]|uniref:hypothetical protein n=1 Tax=Enterobacter hormaechei TaxID=158836 RepID=UPI00203CAB54
IGRCGQHAAGVDRRATSEVGGNGLVGRKQLGTVDGLAAGGADLARAQVAQRGGGAALAQRGTGVVDAAVAVEVIAQGALLR